MTLPTTLAIDTVRDRLQLALARADGTLVSVSEAVSRGHAEIIMGRMSDLLDQAGVDYGQLDRVAALSGPGSFTGLRIGLSIARGLGLTLSIPVFGIPTLTALSLSGAATVAVDARRGEAYLQRFSAPGVAETALSLTSSDAALAALSAATFPDPVADIGRVALFAQAADPAAWPPDPVYVRSADAKPQAAAVIARA